MIPPHKSEEEVETYMVNNTTFEFMKILGAGTFGKVSVVRCLVSSQLEDAELGDPRRIKLTEE